MRVTFLSGCLRFVHVHLFHFLVVAIDQIVLGSVMEITSKAWDDRWSGHKWVTQVAQLLDASAKSLPPPVAAAFLKKHLVSAVLASPLVVSYIAHAVATRLIPLDQYVSVLGASVTSKAVSTADSVVLLQPAVMMLNVYDGAELPRVALDIYQLLLDGTLQFAQTILGAARPAVSDGAVQASSNLEMEWKGALKRLNEMQPAVSETGLPLCVPLLAHFEVPRLIAALLSALSTAPEKRNAIVKANAEMNSLCDRSPQLASLKRAVLLLRALQQPTLDAVNYLAVSPSRPLLFQRTLSSFKLAISAMLSSADLFLFSDPGALFERLRTLHALSHASLFEHIISAFTSLYVAADPLRRALFLGVFPAFFARWSSASPLSPASENVALRDAIAAHSRSSAVSSDLLPFLVHAQLIASTEGVGVAVTALQAQTAYNGLEQQLNAAQVAALPNLLSLFTSAPQLQRRIGELLIAQIDATEALRTAVVTAITEQRDALLPLLHVHGLVPSLLAALLRALDTVGNSTGGSAHLQFSILIFLCAELVARHRLHEGSPEALARAIVSAPSSDREASKRVRSTGGATHKWLLSFRRSAPGGDRVEDAVTSALNGALTGGLGQALLDRHTPWQLWPALPFALPPVLRSPTDAQLLPERFQALIESAPYLILRTAEWLQCELLTGVDSGGLGPWAPILLRSASSATAVQLMCAHVMDHFITVFAPPPVPPPLVPSPDPPASQLIRAVSTLAERAEFDSACIATLRSCRTRLGDTAFVLALLEYVFRPPTGLRDELFACSAVAPAEAIAWVLHVASVQPSVLMAHLSPVLAELEQQPRGSQLAVLVGTSAALDVRYVTPLWSVVLTGLPRSVATPSETFFTPLAAMLLGLGVPSMQLRAAEALRLAGLERFALLAFDWSDAAAREQASAFFALQKR